MPKVTILTPSYNKPEIVKSTIKSVLNQTFKDFEYIIVENSTNTETKKAVRNFKDSRIRYFDEYFSDEQRKQFYVPAYIINTYYPKAKGEFILYLSDDDLLMPDCLEVMIDFFHNNSNISICYHDQAIFYQFSNNVSFEPLIRGGNKVLSKSTLNPRDILDGGQIMFKKDVLKNMKDSYFPIDWKSADICDKIFMEKLSEKYAFYPVGKMLSIHRVVNNSTHRIRNPFKYYLYQYATQFLPTSVQRLIGIFNNKRRAKTADDKRRLQFIREYLINDDNQK